MTPDNTYTGHLHDPESRVSWGITWPRFAAILVLLTIAYWAIL